MIDQFDITKMLPRANPKPAIYNPFPFDTSKFTKQAIRKHYPELEHKLIQD